MNKSKKIISTLGSYSGYKSGIIKNPLTLVKSGPCQFWLDGKDNSKLSLNGNKVIQWYDKSGFGRHVFNAVDAQRPTYDPVTGKVTFNSAAQTYLQSAAFAAPLVQPNTVFLVYKINEYINISVVLDGVTNRTMFWTQSLKFCIYANISLPAITHDLFDHIHIAEYNGLNSNYWIDEILEANGDSGLASIDGITLGSNQSLSSQFSTCQVMELFGYNCSIKSGERIKCENYLYKKHGLTY